MVLLYIVVLTLGFGQMFAFLSSIQQIYAEIYDSAESFPLWFAVTGRDLGRGDDRQRDAGDAARDAAARHRGLRGADGDRGRSCCW
jgi:hypothetical protein